MYTSHWNIIFTLALPSLIYVIYPQTLGLFNAKGLVGFRENIKTKKHLIIVGILATAILRFFAIGSTANGSLLGALGGTLSLLISSTIGFAVMYLSGAVFSWIFQLIFEMQEFRQKMKAQREEWEKTHQQPKDEHSEVDAQK